MAQKPVLRVEWARVRGMFVARRERAVVLLRGGRAWHRVAPAWAPSSKNALCTLPHDDLLQVQEGPVRESS